MTAIRVTFTAISLIGLLCMFVPVFTIREKDYVTAAPSESTALKSLAATFKNRDFRVFVASDIAYFLGITMFQTALPFFVTSLLKLDEGMSTVYFVLMTALSVLFYVPINKLTPKFGKKKLIVVGFFAYAFVFFITSICGKGLYWGFIVAVCAAVPQAILGILPQACVADVAELSRLETGEDRSGMFFAARTFAFKMGQAIAMVVFTSITVATILDNGEKYVAPSQYRTTAIVAFVTCLIGACLFLLYNEKMILGRIGELKAEKAAQ